MNANRVVVSCVAGVLLAGCAGMEKRDTYVPPPRAPSGADADVAYMAYVERVAQRRGIHVTWVHPPRRRAAAPKSE